MSKNQANSERGSVLATPVNHSNMKLPNSTKNAKIKQIQATSERGSVLATPVTPGI
jgi:pseudouridine-5'-phosphate glycosidase